MFLQTRSLLEDLLNLFFPNLCAGCDAHLLREEDCICMSCQMTMPVTGFERSPVNPVIRQFWGKIPVNAATAYCQFNKGGKVQQMIHRLKYDNRPDVGVKLGRMFAHELLSSGWQRGIDLIVPVPLHKSKLRLRGYNQATCIGEGLSGILDIPMADDVVQRKRKTDTQTRKSRFDRSGNVMNVFEVSDPERLRGKHILLIDDVITTGSTLVSCAEALLDVPRVNLSIAALAFAHL